MPRDRLERKSTIDIDKMKNARRFTEAPKREQGELHRKKTERATR